MKKILLTSLLLLGSTAVFADAFDNIENSTDSQFDEIAGGDEQFEFIRYSPENVQLSIADDMKLACKDGMCTLFAINEAGSEFKTTFDIGEGASHGSSSNGVVIVPNGSEVVKGEVNPYVGLTISYKYDKCKQEVKVPRSLYIAMNTYMYGLMNEDGTARRSFTPADEAMIIFYSTIIKQATGCR